MKFLILSLVLLSLPLRAARYVVEAERILSPVEMEKTGLKIEPFYPTAQEYFSRLYIVSTEMNLHELSELSWMRKVEEGPELTAFSLLPAEEPRRIVQDELFSYQWGLLNQGQTFLREKDDIHNLPLKGVNNKDIGWKKLLPSISTNRPIVAVLDSGVDLNHPELKDNLWKNKLECEGDPKVDNDGNKLAGDCHGWNFTEAIDSDLARDPSDRDGHGTHVASIVASAHDGKGIVGVAPNALIMPIKVMKDSDSTSNVPSSESFARGILYAIDNGAQIINMSLGWPRSMETKFLREAVYYALSKGVIIVAAAGNNNSAEPLFPCAYEGVLCVASSTLDGGFAGFSNYGGHVDTIAPGEGILGAHPLFLEPDFFAVPGYEVRSGTSQSTPFVTGLVASLLSQEESLTIDDVLARFYQSKNYSHKTKYVLGSEARWEVLAQKVESPVLRPILKRVRQILVRGDSSQVSIPVRNFGTPSEKATLKLESLSRGLKILTSMQTVNELQKGQGQEIVFNIQIEDFFAESNVILKITLNDGHKTESYINEIPVMRDISEEEMFKKNDFSFRHNPLPVGGVRNGEIYSFLSTVESYRNSKRHELYLRRFLKKEASTQLEITLFSREADKFQEAPRLILIDHAIALVNFIRVDLNKDGKEDYMVHTLADKGGDKYFVFSFYDSELKPLWPSFQHVKLNLNLYLESMNTIAFTEYTDTHLGEMLVPAFFTHGQLPKEDQVLSSWDRLDVNPKRRLYYLMPLKDQSFQVRSFTTNIWEEALKKELKSKWYETVETEQLLPISVEDIEQGRLRVLVSVGMGTRRKLFIHSFKINRSQRGPQLPQLVLQTEEIDPLLNISDNGLEVRGEVYFNIYDRERAKIVTTKDMDQHSEYIYRHTSETDLVAGHLASFETPTGQFSVLQTREELISVQRAEKVKVSRRPKLRYSFLSQKLLSEMYYPVIYSRSGLSSGALYVDSTAVTGNRISILEDQAGNLVSSIKNSLAVPNNCRAMNPYFSPDASAHEFVFLCLENRTWTIRTMEMN
jgi:cell wall-associated protease